MQLSQNEYDVERRMWCLYYNTSHKWEGDKVYKDLVKYFVGSDGDLVPLMEYEILGGIFVPHCHLLFKGKKLPLPN